MELLDDESHRLLLWAVRLDEVGHAPSRRELRRVSEPRRPAGASVVTGLLNQPAGFGEGAITSLLRRGLLQEVSEDRLSPTDLGRRVTDALGLHAELGPFFEVLDVDLRSSDPLAFARIAGRIASLHRPMVVDPYLCRSELEYLTAHTSVSRVLVSDRLGEEDLAELADFVRSVRERPVKLRLRVAPAAELRDRHVISRDRVLEVAGVPHPEGPGMTVLTEPRDLGDVTRNYYRAVWKRARRLARYTPGRSEHRKVA